MFHGYAIQGVRHLLESRAARKAAGATGASDTEG